LDRHLDDEWIARALAGELPASAATQALNHAETCADCRVQLEGLETASVSREVAVADATRPVRTPTPRPIPGGGLARVGRYQIVGRLGEGGMGAVYSALDPELDRRVAVKVLHAPGEGLGATLGQARLLREAQAMARLQHPNVIAVYDVGTVDGSVFFAMEQVEGGTLRGWLSEPRSWREVVAVFLQAGRGLAAAHKAGIVHRDFKPENVLVGQDGRVRVTDFGVARARDAADAIALTTAEAARPLGPTLTRHGQVIGTPGYLAPEQLDGNVTPQSDQFSFCVTLYEALVGERLYTRWPHAAYFRELRSKQIEFPAKTAVPHFVRDVVLRGLRLDPAQRFASMDALLDALVRDPRARRLRVGVTAAVAATAILVGGGALLRRAQHQRDCTQLAARAERSWQANRGAISAAFRAANKPLMASVQRTVETGFAAFAREWGEAARAVCLGTAGLPREQLPASNACLDLAGATMHDAAELLARGDATVVLHAGQMLAALPAVKSCVNIEALRSQPPPPRDPTKAAVVPQARARLARAEILAIARPQDGITSIKAELAAIEQLGATPALAEAQFVLGEAEVKADLTVDAARSLQRAAELALAGGDDRLFVRAASRLAYVVGGFHNEAARAADWMALAQKTFERTGRPPALEAWLSLQEVALHIGAGRWAACAEAAERAIAGAQREEDHVHEAEATFLLSFCRGYAQGPAAARPVVERALDLYLTWVGPGHPETAVAMASLADFRRDDGDLAAAIALGEQSLQITRSIGHPTVQLALSLDNQAERLASAGRNAEALALRREGLEVLRQVTHPPKSDVRVLAGLAITERAMGMRAEAVAHAAAANSACTAEVQQGFPDICALAQFIEAKLLVDRGRRAEAARLATRARDGFATQEFEPELRTQVETWAREVGIRLFKPAAR
jgi:tetratricopeptide (TPR) repeat protein